MSEKADSGFVGIRNPGCICYMNSLMQQVGRDYPACKPQTVPMFTVSCRRACARVRVQFFMMKSLRYGILSSPDASLLPPPEPAEDGTVVTVDEVLKEDVLFQLQVGLLAPVWYRLRLVARVHAQVVDPLAWPSVWSLPPCRPCLATC